MIDKKKKRLKKEAKSTKVLIENRDENGSFVGAVVNQNPPKSNGILIGIFGFAVFIVFSFFWINAIVKSELKKQHINS